MIYHYTSLDGLKGILSSKKLWLTYSQELSDITDRSYAYTSVLVNLFKSQNSDAKLLLEHLSANDILDVMQELFDVPFYSTSFCKRNDNDYLWEYYADNYNGFCLKIDEAYLKENITKILKENYNPLDKEDKYDDEYNLNVRDIFYNLDEENFNKALKISKSLSGIEYVNSEKQSSKAKFWLKIILMIFAGTIKHNNFHNEEEARILFQNFFDEEYINKHTYYLLDKEHYKDAYIKLGLDKEAKDGKRRMELNLQSFFDSKLILEIIVGKNFRGNLKEIKDFILANNLTNTEVFEQN